MSSSVHFRFKSARQFETLSFEGDFLKVADLKVAIVERKKLNFGEGFDLEISDASTGDVFNDESALVQKNTSVIVRRIPGLKQGGILSHQEMAAKNERYAEKQPSKPHQQNPVPSDQNPALPKTIEGSDEAERIASLVMQSNVQYDQFPPPVRARYANRSNNRGRPSSFGASRNPQAQSSFPTPGHTASAYPERAPRPSSNYVCHRCNRPGHWIDLCPTNGDPTYDRIKVRAPTGIPRSMLRQVDAPESGTGLQDSSGHFVTLQPNEEEFARQTVGLRLSQAAASGGDKDADSSVPVKDGDNDVRGDEKETSNVASQQAPEGDVNQNATVRAINGQQVHGKSPQDAKDIASDGGKQESNGSSKRASVEPRVSHESRTVQNANETTAKPSETGRPSHHGKKSSVSSRIRQPPPPPRGGVPNIPMPAIPPGFPPPGMPPILPGMPPIPPHILMAMAMTNKQNGRPPHLPPGIPPKIPIPFSTSAPSGMDKKNQGVVTEMQKASSEHQRDTSDAASPEDAVGKRRNGDEKPSPESQSSRDDRDRNETDARDEEEPDQQDVDHPSSEMIESAFNSKPDSHPSRAPRLDRSDTRALKQRSFYETEDGLRVEYRPYNRKETNYRSRSPSSSRVRSSLEDVRISPRRIERRQKAEGGNSSTSPRRAAFEKRHEDCYSRSGRREERKMRYRSSGLREDAPRDEIIGDARRGFYSRKQSRSPSVRGRHEMNGTRSSGSPVGRSRSPERYSRYSSPARTFRGNNSRGRRSKDSPDRRFRRDSSMERRFRSRTPPRSSRYDSRTRKDFHLRQHGLSDPRRSPSIEKGRDLVFVRGSHENRRHYEPGDRVRPTMSESEKDERGPKVHHDDVGLYQADGRKGAQDISRQTSQNSLDEKREEHDILRGSRRKRDFDSRSTSEQRNFKRPRREDMEERKTVSYQQMRDRPSVHDRLGRPVESRRRKRPRRSVHDRLG